MKKELINFLVLTFCFFVCMVHRLFGFNDKKYVSKQDKSVSLC